jgi:hypothetical protein
MPARKAVTKKRATKKKTAAKRLPALSFLILECDADKLARQNLSVANELHQIAHIIPAKITKEVAFINSAADLQERFIGYKQKYSSIKLIVVIAHSNREVISIAPDMVLTWEAFAHWVLPFNPQKMVFIACEAGQFPATRTLFDEIPKLNKIYASPLKTSLAHAQVIKLLVPYLLLSKKLDNDIIQLGSLLNFFKTGGVILQCSRRNTEWNQFWQFIGSLT